MLRRILTVVSTLLTAFVLLIVSAVPAWAAQAITLTWVRHAQSTANAAGIIDTMVPGPGLTALGDTQAQAIAETLKANAYDGIYVSNMVRTQLTAAPLATDLGLAPVILPGVREVNSGIFEGRSGLLAGIGYALPPVAWVAGARFVPVLGGENGNGFDARVNDAVATIYASGDTNAVVFSHGATIMAWTLMTVDNPNLLLALTHPLGNTAVVIVTGNPEDGWSLQSWDGVAVDPNPGLLTKLFVAVRNVVVAPQTALYDICHPPSAGSTNATASPVSASRARRTPIAIAETESVTINTAELKSAPRRMGNSTARNMPSVITLMHQPADASVVGKINAGTADERPAAMSRRADRGHVDSRSAA